MEIESSDELNFKLLPPPAGLPKYSEESKSEISYFAKTNFSSSLYRSSEPFGIKRSDRGRHVYVIGKSGMGKTYLLDQLIRYDVLFGHGLAVCDPHGDLAKSIVNFIPASRADDVIYIDPHDLDRPVAFNPFGSVPVEYRQVVSQGLVEIFKKQFASTWTPRIEHLFRFAALAMLEYPEGTLYGFLQLLTDAHYRQKVLENIKDEVVKRFFSVEFASFSQKYDQEAITPLTNRLGQFFSDPLMRAIFSCKENKIDFDEIINHGKILIINASKGSLGEENSALFASFFLTKIEQMAMARSTMAVEERSPFYLYVDEFQNVATRSFISLFSESRKYAVNITVANQYLEQISKDLQEAIFGNIGTLICFRVSGSDAERIVQEFRPVLEPHDLINIGLRDFYIKMSFGGKTTPPFSAVTLDLEPPPWPSNAELILKNTKEKYGQDNPQANVEEKKAPEDAEEPLPPPV